MSEEEKPMQEFYVSFGQKYRHETHPRIPEIHPDGWLTIVAKNYTSARAHAFATMGPAWCMLYDAAEFEKMKHHFPRGEIVRLTAPTLEDPPI
jgi:hypothetical protein